MWGQRSAGLFGPTTPNEACVGWHVVAVMIRTVSKEYTSRYAKVSLVPYMAQFARACLV